MKFDIQHRPAYALAIVHLEPGETIVAEGGAMVSMSPGIEMETSMGKKGDGLVAGLLKGLKRMVASESVFQNRFTAPSSGGHVTFAPGPQGDITTYELAPELDLYLQSSAFLVSDDAIEVSASWGGARSFFGGEGLIMLKATGSGPIAFNSFGGIREVEVDGEYILDTGHIVAFESTLSFDVQRFGGGWKAFLFGGEGLVCRFKGKGRLWMQTRNLNAFGQLLGQRLPPREA